MVCPIYLRHNPQCVNVYSFVYISLFAKFILLYRYICIERLDIVHLWLDV